MQPTRRADWSGAVRRETDGRAFEATSGDLTTGGTPVRSTSRFQAGSISKTVLAITVLHLVERGVLDLAAPIGERAPTRPARKGRLTLHQLLTHTSGLGHWRDLPEVDVADPPHRAELLRIVLDRPAPHPVGTFSYSSFGYLLAAAVIEEATGRSYAAMATEAVLVPAGMTRSTSGIFPVGAPDCASGHHDGAPLVTSSAPTSIPGTGDLWTTVDDLIRLSRALHAGRLLRLEHVAVMMSALVPFPSETTVADDRISGVGYGYGTWIGAVEGEPAAIHPGDNVGYRSLLVHLLGRHDDIAILTNDDGPTLKVPLDLALTARRNPEHAP
jgi:CubicO group peptidase (beta-lactamase class C family)